MSGPSRDAPAGSDPHGDAEGPADEAVGRLFVYGTLRPGGGAPAEMRRLLEQGAEREGSARVRGRLLAAGGGRYPALVLDREGGRVIGDLYRLSSPGAILRSLDRYEGRRPDGSGLYRREVVEAQLLERGNAGGRSSAGPVGRSERAWAYVYNRDAPGLERIESGDWLHR